MSGVDSLMSRLMMGSEGPVIQADSAWFFGRSSARRHRDRVGLDRSAEDEGFENIVWLGRESVLTSAQPPSEQQLFIADSQLEGD